MVIPVGTTAYTGNFTPTSRRTFFGAVIGRIERFAGLASRIRQAFVERGNDHLHHLFRRDFRKGEVTNYFIRFFD